MTTTVHDLTIEAAEHLRASVHNLRQRGAPTGGDTCIIVDDLTRLTQSTEPLLRQLDLNLHARIDIGELRHDTGGPR